MRRPLALVVSVALATACGSTVQSTSTIGGGAVPVGDGLGTTGPSTTGGSTPVLGGSQSATSTTGGGVAGGSTGRSAGTTGEIDPTTGRPVTSPPLAGGRAPGVTDTAVYVGFVYDENAGALNNASGVGSITSGNPDANDRAVINDINAHGGLGGRKLVAVKASYDQTSTQTFDQQFAAVCQRFTQDSRVFAVLDAGLAVAGSYRDCLSRAGVGIVNNGFPISDAATFAAHPGYLELGAPNIDRLAAYQVQALVAQKYFTPWDALNGGPAAAGTVKVGVLTYDDRDFAHAVDQVLVPALKRLGYTPVVERVSQLSAVSDTGSQAAAVKAAQLAFASNGVTHVIPFETNGNLSTFFLPTARSQAYYPRYGVSTASASEALLESGAVEARQMNGAVGFGWAPAVDLRMSDFTATGPYANAATRSCLQVMRKNGITFDSGNAQYIGLMSCAKLYLLKTVFDRMPKQVSLDGFLRTAASLGTSYLQAGGLGLDFRPGRQDPTSRAYFWHYVPGCTCMQYTGKLVTIP